MILKSIATNNIARHLLSAGLLVAGLVAAVQPAHATRARASNASNWDANFNSAPSCSGCHSMTRGSFGPQDVQVSSAANGARVAVTGTNGDYFWRYRQNGVGSAVFTSPVQIGSLSSGVNSMDFCVVEVTQRGMALRTWNCGQFDVTVNEPVTVVADNDNNNEPPANEPVSQPPANNNSSNNSNQCIDTDPVGDGWGWNGSSSCRLAVTVTAGNSNNTGECVDTHPVGDGWGWNGSSSCRIGGSSVSPAANTSANGSCLDTDPVGDGWGWNGSTSCRIGTGNSVSTNTDMTCVDTDPVGDGWGWNGSSSCRVSGGATANVASGECVDTDPVGDGWGWDGSSSCRVAGGNNNNSGTSNNTGNNTGNSNNTGNTVASGADGQWYVCNAYNQSFATTWQYKHDWWSKEACVLKCSGDTSNEPSFDSWGWDSKGKFCLSTNTANSNLASVPLYVDGNRVAFDTQISRAKLIRNGGSWSCRQQVRADMWDSFSNTGYDFTIQYSSDGSLTYGKDDHSWSIWGYAHDVSSSWSNWTDWGNWGNWLNYDYTWSLSGRTLELNTHSPVKYRNIDLASVNGQEHLYLYQTGKSRIDCR